MNSPSTPSTLPASTAPNPTRRPAFLTLGKQAVAAWLNDYAPSMGAALSYYTLFSIGPLLLIVIAIGGLVFGQDPARDAILRQVSGLVGDAGGEAVKGMVGTFSLRERGIVATLLSGGALLIGATSAFAELRDALNRIWRDEAHPRPVKSGAWNFIRTRLLSMGLILCLGFLSMVSLVFNAALSAMSGWWTPFFGEAALLAQAADFIVSLGLTTVLFAMLYKWVPDAKVRWHDVWIGAALTAALFTLGKWAIGLYIGHSNITSGFGAAASLVVLMVWVYYSAQVFLLGAELTWAYAQRGKPAAAGQQGTPAAPSAGG